ncbi:peroxiredoxin [Aurantiacibacter gangjinensis]|uniref:thioredoxin-dependent peroxiredoxin n=1 Tax=Aurantiacibacter gangjinensis TaxID=502682 RepID=A0A0G9MLE7_9SPHN|nr:peroxiredoxin [Aurantiacibacter gangjinensis]APE27359.1 Thiol peroxidase, Bcp-type [Aurantiacibacter gangjinensis]KLE31449.1 alkyl hydroperoxide reductase [Aurantiacibacter gangjinensis]
MSDSRPDTGDMMPDTAMEGADGATIKPSDFRGRKLVMFFYPKDMTPGCTTENIEFTHSRADFEAADTALLGVSKDPYARHEKFIAKHDLANPLASDPEKDGIADALGIWVEKKMYGKTFMGMERTTYLVDAEGRIARVWRKVKVKGHVEEVLEAARSL